MSLTKTSAVMEWSTRPQVVSPLGVVPKKGSDQWRLIWDGRYVNSHLQIPKFKYETLAQLHQWAEMHDYVSTLDLKSLATTIWTWQKRRGHTLVLTVEGQVLLLHAVPVWVGHSMLGFQQAHQSGVAALSHAGHPMHWIH
jgi:hypothetical protein